MGGRRRERYLRGRARLCRRGFARLMNSAFDVGCFRRKRILLGWADSAQDDNFIIEIASHYSTKDCERTGHSQTPG
jgi:hypothetical protein